MQFNFTLILLVKTCIYVRNGKAETKHFFSATFCHKLKSTSARLLHFLQQKKKKKIEVQGFPRNLSCLYNTLSKSHTKFGCLHIIDGCHKGMVGEWDEVALYFPMVLHCDKIF